jgi:hypothetical protein
MTLLGLMDHYATFLVAGRFACDGLAARCARAGRPWGLGPAPSRTARHGGQATNATIDAQTSTGL